MSDEVKFEDFLNEEKKKDFVLENKKRFAELAKKNAIKYKDLLERLKDA